MSGPLWVPGSIRLEPSYGGGTPDYPSAPPRSVAHTTECPSGDYDGQHGYWFWKMHQVLKGKSAEPSLLYDPVNDMLGQYFPLNQTGRALLNDGSRRTNRVGRVCIQIEFVGWASRPFTRTWTPGPNFQAMMRAIGAWGIPDLWPSGKPPAYPNETDERSRDIWYGRGGWFGHSQVPGNYHGDPGAIDDDGEFFAAVKQPRQYWPGWPQTFPGQERIGSGEGSSAPLNLLVKSALIAHLGPAGWTGEVDAKWNKVTSDKLAEFIKDRKLDADGLGPAVWAELGTMPADAPSFPDPSKAFSDGDNSPHALTAQALLVLQGFGRAMRGTISRKWGPEVRRALRRFQLSEPRLAGDADGEFGPLTWKLAWTDND